MNANSGFNFGFGMVFGVFIAVLVICCGLPVLMCSPIFGQSADTSNAADAHWPQPSPSSSYVHDPNVAHEVKVLKVHTQWFGPMLYATADWLNMGNTPIRQVYGRFEARDESGSLIMYVYDWLYYGDGSEEPDTAVQPKMAYRVRNLQIEGEPFDVYDTDRRLSSMTLTVAFIPTQAYATLETDVRLNR